MEGIKINWNLDDGGRYKKIANFMLDFSYTYGSDDAQKRDKIRTIAANAANRSNDDFFFTKGEKKYIAFRITVYKPSGRPVDVDNVPKLIIDSFNRSVLKIDHGENGKYSDLSLYEDDSCEHVSMVQIYGTRSPQDDVHNKNNSTLVEIYLDSLEQQIVGIQES